MKDISDLPPHLTTELRSFFEDYKKLEHKEVIVEEFQGRETAMQVINQAVIDYKEKFGKEITE